MQRSCVGSRVFRKPGAELSALCSCEWLCGLVERLSGSLAVGLPRSRGRLATKELVPCLPTDPLAGKLEYSFEQGLLGSRAGRATAPPEQHIWPLSRCSMCLTVLKIRGAHCVSDAPLAGQVGSEMGVVLEKPQLFVSFAKSPPPVFENNEICMAIRNSLEFVHSWEFCVLF